MTNPKHHRSADRDDAAARRRIGFFLVPQLALMSFSSALEALRAANRLAGRELYDWVLISIEGGPVTSSSNVQVAPTLAIDGHPELDELIVVAGIGGESFRNEKVFAWLRRLDRKGCQIGAVTLGSYILARAGLLKGYRCTVHWENLDSFREEFPDLDVTSEVFEIDRDRSTCSGGTAALDMMLALIAEAHGGRDAGRGRIPGADHRTPDFDSRLRRAAAQLVAPPIRALDSTGPQRRSACQ